MNNFLLFIAAVLVLALSALFAAPYFVDWNDYRHVFERQASRLLGREVNVGGNVSLTLLPAPVLRFENINVASSDGAFDAPFFSARSFSVWLAVPPLLRGTVEAREVELVDATLNLRTDAAGAGNWKDVGRPDVALPFMPGSVVLDSVKISGATVNVAHGDHPPDLIVENLRGELSARSLRGPYKFSGTFDWRGSARDIRLSTSRQAVDGTVRVKAVVRDEKGGASYQLDGDLVDFTGKPVFDGRFEASFLDGPAAEPLAKPPAEPVPAPLAIKSHIKADLTHAAFTEIEIALRRGGKPQTIAGTLDAKYRDGLRIAGSFASSWVDLDLLSPAAAGNAERPAPSAAVAALAAGALDVASKVEEADVSLRFTQAVVGGDLLADVVMKLSVDGSGLQVSGFRALLPGENPVSVSGSLAAEEGQPTFSGRFEVSGKKLNRLLAWSGLESQPAVAAQDGDFSLRGHIAASGTGFSLQESTGQLFGSRFSGSLEYSAGTQRKFDLTLHSDRLDISRVTGGGAKPLSLIALLRGKGDGSTGPRAEVGPFSWIGDSEARIDLDIGAVTLPGLGESALKAGLHLDRNDVDVRNLVLESDTGLELRAKGTLTDLTQNPRGEITVTAQAGAARGVHALAGLLGLDAIVTSGPSRYSALAPAKLTASIRSLSDGRKGLSVTIDGDLAETALRVKADIGNSPAGWRHSDVAVEAGLGNPSSRRLLTQLLSHLSEADVTAFADGPAKLSLVASGVAQAALDTDFRFSAAGMDWRTRGQLALPDSGPGFTGTVVGSADDATGLPLLIGIEMAPGWSAGNVKVEADLKLADGAYNIENIAGQLPSGSLTGSAEIDLSGDKPEIRADLKTASASLPLLLQPVINWQSEVPLRAGVVRGATRGASFWPDEAIDDARLAAINGSLTLSSGSLRLVGAVALREAELEARLENGVLEIEALGGELFGGSFDATAQISSQTGGVLLQARAHADGLRLEQLVTGRANEALAEGSVDVDVSVKGSGRSPRGLVASLNGDGTLKFSEGSIRRLAPAAPQQVAAEHGVRAGKKKIEEGVLRAAIAEQLASANFNYAPFQTHLVVRNGVVRVEKVTLDNPAGKAAVTSFLELTDLRLDSEWVLESVGDTEREAPRVTLAFAGPLSQLGALRPEIDSQALQRLVTIRRMEQDVERLEKLKVPGANRDNEGTRIRGDRPGEGPPQTAPADEQDAAAADRRESERPPAPPPPAAKPAPVPRASPPAAPRRNNLPNDTVVSTPEPPAPAVPEAAAPPPPPTLPWATPSQPQSENRQAPGASQYPLQPVPPVPPSSVVPPELAQPDPQRAHPPPSREQDADIFSRDGG